MDLSSQDFLNPILFLFLMRDNAEIKEMCLKLIEQHDKIEESNKVAAQRLMERLLVFQWLLQTETAPATLLYSDDELEFLKAFY